MVAVVVVVIVVVVLVVAPAAVAFRFSRWKGFQEHTKKPEPTSYIWCKDLARRRWTFG